MAVSATPRTLQALTGSAVLVALLLGGCTSRGDSAAAGKAIPARGGVDASPASPEPSAPAPVAADGTNYAACADGTCEISIPGPVDIRVGGGTLKVTKASAQDGLEFDLTLASGAGGNGTLKGTCGTVASFYLGGGGGTMTSPSCDGTGVPEPPEPMPGALSMQLVGWSPDGAAVLRLITG